MSIYCFTKLLFLEKETLHIFLIYFLFLFTDMVYFSEEDVKMTYFAENLKVIKSENKTRDLCRR